MARVEFLGCAYYKQQDADIYQANETCLDMTLNHYRQARGVKIVKGGTVIACILALCLPVIQMQFEIFSISPVAENRTKAKKPSNWRALLQPNSSFSSDYDRYFNDNFGLRDFLIRVKNQFDYSLFGFSSQVHIGPNGWLFYKDTYETTVMNLERLRPSMATLISRMRRLRDNLSARGMTLVVIPCPMKTTIYPEELPKLNIQLPASSAFDEYRDFLREEPGIISLDVVGQMIALKEKMPVYHRTDFHWNDPAAAYVLNDLLTALEKASGITVSKKPRIDARIDKKTGGGEINSLAVFWPPYENMLMLAKAPDTSEGTMVDSGRSNQWAYTARDPTDQSLIPATVIFGDSFSDAFLRAGFIGRFREIHKFYNLEFKEKFKEIPSDTKFVILEHIESNLGSMLLDSYWPEDLR